MKILQIFILCAVVKAQTVIDLTRQGRFQVGPTLPATCSIGQIFLLSSANPGQNVYVCMSSNVWIQQSVMLGLTYNASFSSTPTFDLSQGNNQKIILTGTVTNIFLTNIVPNFVYNFWFCQDSIGGHEVTFPFSFHGAMSVGLFSSSCSFQSFLATDSTNLRAIGPGSTNQL